MFLKESRNKNRGAYIETCLDILGAFSHLLLATAHQFLNPFLSARVKSVSLHK
jgi:hypothetical protein